MGDQVTLTVSKKRLLSAVLLGVPGIVLWAIGGFGAFSLLMGLHAGSVTPGVRSSGLSLSLLWGMIGLLAAGGIVLGFMSFLRNVPRSLLGCSLFLAFVSLFFSVLAD